MSDRLIVSIDSLDSISTRLSLLESRLSNARSMLANIDLGLIIGSTCWCQINGGRQATTGKFISSYGSANTLSNQHESALDKLADYVSSLRSALKQVREQFVQTEDSITDKAKRFEFSPEELSALQELELQCMMAETHFDAYTSALLPPSALYSVCKKEETGFITEAALKAWAALSLDAEAVFEYNKTSYLYSSVLKSLDMSNAYVFDSGEISNLMKHVNNTGNLNEALMTDWMRSLSEICPDMSNELVKDMCDQLLKDPNYSMEDAKEMLENMGVGSDNMDEALSALDDYEILGDLLKTAEAYGLLAKGTDAVCNAMNQVAIIQSVDPKQLTDIARVYRQTGDADMAKVASKLERIANADTNEMMAMVVGGELAEFGLDVVVDKALNTVVDKAVGSLNPYKIAVDCTMGAMDFVGGVNDLPKLYNEMSFATDAAIATYEVYKNDLNTYQANPTLENMAALKNSSETYARAAATAERACGAIYKNCRESLVGDITMSEEAKGYVEVCEKTATRFEERMSNINSYFNEYQAVSAQIATFNVS